MAGIDPQIGAVSRSGWNGLKSFFATSYRLAELERRTTRNEDQLNQLTVRVAQQFERIRAFNENLPNMVSAEVCAHLLNISSRLAAIEAALLPPPRQLGQLPPIVE